MKRGSFGLSLLFSILLVPFVSAATNDVLDILIGSSESSMVFLRFMYGALIFIIFLSVTKKTIFKAADANDKQSKKLGNVFSLILAIFATRFTPESVVQNFGWVIMFLTPLLIYYTLFGIFTRAKVQKADDKELNFSWTRFILALIATLFTLSALGKNNYLGNFPFIGGGLNELFFDLNYYLFDKWLPFLLILIFLGIITALLSKFGGFGTKKDADGKEIPSLIPGWIILALLLLLLLIGLAYLFGGGFPSLIGILTWLLGLSWWWWLLLLLIPLILLLIRFFPLLKGLLGIFKRTPRAPGTPVVPKLSDRIRIDLTANGRTVSSNGPVRRALITEPDTPLLIGIEVSIRRWYWSNKPVQNANLILSAAPGTIPGSSRTDAGGKANVTYNPPSNDTTAYLTISVAPTSSSAAYTSPRFPIEIKEKNKLIASVSPSNIVVDIGNPATINVYVRDKKGNPIIDEDANIIIDFDKASIPSITSVSDAAGLATAITPNLPAARTHDFKATVTHPKYKKPAKASGTITVRNPTTPDLDVTLITALPITVPYGNSINIEFSVTERGATPVIPINTAKFTITPRIGTPSSGIISRFLSPVKRNPSFNGRYSLTITPDRTQAGSTITFSVNVANKGYNDNNSTFDVTVPALPPMTITPNFPSVMNAKNSSIIQVAVTDATGTNVYATLEASFTTGGSTSTKLNFTRNSSGIYTSNFTPLKHGVHQFTFTATHPKFADATIFSNQNVAPALPVLINFIAPASMVVNSSVDLQVEIKDTSGTNVDATLEVKVSVGSAAQSTLNFTKTSAGVYTYNRFTPTIPSKDYQFTFTATHPKFADTTLSKKISVSPLPPLSFACVLIWAPNPSNQYQLMQIKVVNSNTGNPVNGATVSITDPHSNPINITGSLVTNNLGSFPSQIRLQPTRTVSTSEPHNLTVSVSASGFPRNSTSVLLTFDPPGSPLGGVNRKVF